jgi:hypothetical protein
MGGELVKGLAPELGTGPAPMPPDLLATAFGDGSDAGELLHFRSVLVALAVSAEGPSRSA